MLRLVYSFSISLLFLYLPCLPVWGFDHTHSGFSKILKNHVYQQGKQTLVNYRAIKNNPQPLKEYLGHLSAVTSQEFSTFNRQQQLAMLINAYNAFTIKLIIDHYPVESIKDIGSFFRSSWKIKFFTMLGEKMHLDHLEHQIIRKNYQEPRIHFVVNCASLGCPSLWPEAMESDKLDKQLEAATLHFMGNTEKNRFDQQKNKLHLSKIFKWYGDDFTKRYGSVVKFVSRYYRGVNPKDVEWDYLSYDWRLNEYSKK